MSWGSKTPRHFVDLVDDAAATGTPLASAIFDDAMAGIEPITVRPIRPACIGPCPHCGEGRFFCDCDETAP